MYVLYYFPLTTNPALRLNFETWDSCIAANQNTFWEWMGPIITFSRSSHAQPLTVPAQAHPEYQSSSKASTLLATPDSVRLWRSELTEGGRHMSSPHSCRSLGWCRQRAPPLTAKNIPGEKITRGASNALHRYRSSVEND